MKTTTKNMLLTLFILIAAILGALFIYELLSSFNSDNLINVTKNDC